MTRIMHDTHVRHLFAVPLLAAITAFPLDSPLAAQTSDSRTVATAAAAQIAQGYVYPARAATAAAAIRANAAAGAYDALSNDALATKLTGDFAAVLHDKHVRVRYSEETVPPDAPPGGAPDPQQAAMDARMDRYFGYGVGRAAHLPGNVGYIDVREFPAASPQRNFAVDGLANAVAYSDAVIIDMRRNIGGDPDGVARLLSHFLPPKTHLNDFLARGDGDAKVASSSYTAPVPGPQISAPLYVLTSAETFSGGEEVAYDLQALKRATLVGESTGGGANPGDMHRVADHFAIFVPDGRARNPITGTNWDGAGVKPDVAVARDRALAQAYGMALDATIANAPLPPPRKAALAGIRAKLATTDDGGILGL